jgi:hypothetical protein
MSGGLAVGAGAAAAPGGRLADPKRVLRLARAVVSDVMLYHPDEVRRGIESDDLFDRLAEPISEARAWFDSQVLAEVAVRTRAFDLALVDVLVYRNAHVPSRIW